ncbi:ABC transporter ATP-binding protein [Spiroplasma endosymbiont of Nebria brevicollis]|uniref:ABC transporter ATP-binding protein n=1 Tax=Spiroplasma endosymbiont of Nebria brevicollis TaxID=3066284 RepID=UPI00313B7B95
MKVIDLNNITKKYESNVGCFNINITVNKGTVYGFIGPNGAGKTTLIRQMVGFIKSDEGNGTILGYDIWKNSKEIMAKTGYLSGEVMLPEYMTGINYLKTIADIRNNVDWNYTKKLIEYFDFNPKTKIKKMSKGMKQKIAIISAFMHKPELLILDEPTSGLDPLMQKKFDKLVDNFKKENKTIFMSSHIFGEIENNCDKVGIIKNGKIISEVLIEDIKNNSEKNYEIKFSKNVDYNNFISSKKWNIVNKNNKNKILTIFISNAEIDNFLKEISVYKIDYFRELPFDLEKFFIKYYEKEIEFND